MSQRVRAIFLGWQRRRVGPPLALYTLIDAIPGHPVESTVSRETIEGAGYQLDVLSADPAADAAEGGT